MHLLLLEALSLEVAEVEVVEYLQLELDKQVEVMQLQMDQVLMVVREVFPSRWSWNCICYYWKPCR